MQFYTDIGQVLQKLFYDLPVVYQQCILGDLLTDGRQVDGHDTVQTAEHQCEHYHSTAVVQHL